MFREDEALEVAQEFVEKHKLKMSLLGVKREEEVTTFFFSAPQRVNFRSLTRDLQSIFQTEIRFEEAGPREKARHVGGLGRCGMPLCCKKWLPKVPHVPLESLEKASLPVVPEKFTGACGRLLCCLIYENEEEWTKTGMSKPGSDNEQATRKDEKEKIEDISQEGKEKPQKPRIKRIRKLRL